MGNYIYCQECIVKGLHISKQRLARQRKVKKSYPITKKTKLEVEAKSLMAFVMMPEGYTEILFLQIMK